ncbi:hypothetical protein ACFWA4_13830 [Streptomyces sp. NPDC060011]|uniref:hypothetical protein n=2 Tax=unclassified Streptomyces TaxID=2593676 RepID=UPI00224C92FD|nr:MULTISPECIES: hypothetical protein [unclassified Streptomyces]MCX4915508.1 hypothetical protein [Streptomyces sp. NBC_00687]WSD78996.1 hypothetical protein OHB33_23265 [Streptomyces sp. NBC_01558]
MDEGSGMVAELVPLALCTGFGLGFLTLAARSVLGAVRLWLRGLRVMGQVTPRKVADRRPGGLVVFSDHLGRGLVFDPGWRGPLCGLPPVGGSVPVVYAQNRPAAARLWTLRYLLAPSFGWFLSSTLAFGTGVMVSS